MNISRLSHVMQSSPCSISGHSGAKKRYFFNQAGHVDSLACHTGKLRAARGEVASRVRKSVSAHFKRFRACGWTLISGSQEQIAQLRGDIVRIDISPLRSYIDERNYRRPIAQR